MKIEVRHPRCGAVTMIGDPVKLTPPSGRTPAPPPLLGQHTEEVLTSLAGLGPDDLKRLREKKIIG